MRAGIEGPTAPERGYWEGEAADNGYLGLGGRKYISERPAHSNLNSAYADDDVPLPTCGERLCNASKYAARALVVNGLFGALGVGYGRLHQIGTALTTSVGTQIGSAASAVWDTVPSMRPRQCK